MVKLPEFERFLKPREVARLFNVDTRTVLRWAKDGKLPSLQKRGGHRMYKESAVLALLDLPANKVSDIDQSESLISSQAAAKILCCTERTVTRLVVAEHLSATKTVGGHCRFREADVVALNQRGWPGRKKRKNGIG